MAHLAVSLILSLLLIWASRIWQEERSWRHICTSLESDKLRQQRLSHIEVSDGAFGLFYPSYRKTKDLICLVIQA